MDSIPDSDLSIISSAECPYFFLSVCFLNPYASAIATVMAFAVYRVRNDFINKQRNASDINFVFVSLVCSVIFYLNSIFMVNSLLIPWDFSALNYHLADIGDFLSFFSWTIGKSCFYCALCLHLSNQLGNEMETLANRLRYAMYFVSFVLLLLITFTFFDDILENHMKEIGRLECYPTVYMAVSSFFLLSFQRKKSKTQSPLPQENRISCGDVCWSRRDDHHLSH